MQKVIIALILLIGSNLSAQEFSEIKVRNQIENKVKILVDAWTKGDAELFASPFSENADFTVWYGMKLSGQKEIAFGHNIIFKEFYANTVWNLNIDKIRFVGQEIALVHCSGAVRNEGDDSPMEPDTVPLLVFQKINDDWKIITLQNTPFAVNEFRENGDIKRMKRIMREYKE